MSTADDFRAVNRAPLPIIGDQAKLQRLIGRKLPDDLFTFAPWGHRLVVVREEPIKKSGEIYIPDQAQEQIAEGWVISVGSDVGWDNVCPLPAERLIGCKVVFGKYAGDQIGVTSPDPLEQLEDQGLYTILRDSDIWGTVGEPPEESMI